MICSRFRHPVINGERVPLRRGRGPGLTRPGNRSCAASRAIAFNAALEISRPNYRVVDPRVVVNRAWDGREQRRRVLVVGDRLDVDQPPVVHDGVKSAIIWAAIGGSAPSVQLRSSLRRSALCWQRRRWRCRGSRSCGCARRGGGAPRACARRVWRCRSRRGVPRAPEVRSRAA